MEQAMIEVGTPMGLEERVSALADSAFEPAQADHLVDLLLADAHLRTVWEEIHLVGDCLRSDEVGAIQPCTAFLDRFSERLAAEPTILAPFPKNVTSRRNRWLRLGLPGISVAAAVLMVAWIALPPAGESVGGLAVHRASLSNPEPAHPIAVGPSAAAPRLATAHAVDPSRLREYLAAHEQFSMTAVHGPGYVHAATLTVGAPPMNTQP